jgi:hypothetical protein
MRLLGSVTHGAMSDLPVYQAFRDQLRWRGWGSFGDVCLQIVYTAPAIGEARRDADQQRGGASESGFGAGPEVERPVLAREPV